MKEVIHFAGKGFLAVVIGMLVWTAVCFGVRSQSRGKNIRNDTGMYRYEMDYAFEQSKNSDGVQLEWTFEGAILNEIDFNDEQYFRLTGSDAYGFAPIVLSVSEDKTGKKVECVEGKYHFLKSGIYKICVRCNEEVFLLRIPVNVKEDTE